MESGTTDVLTAKVRNTTVTGTDYMAVAIAGSLGDSFDLGTAASPGNNVWQGNYRMVSDPPPANLMFDIAAGVMIYAVGNKWDPNVQGADPNGYYSVLAPGVPLDFVSGGGTNFSSDPDSLGTLRLAE
jgi:hypothetical protein